jgi:hypothetical protein
VKSTYLLEISGFCPICEDSATFVADDPWLRDSLRCTTCPNGSIPRERALAYVLNREFPKWRRKVIHECAPVSRGISLKLAREARNYVQTNLFHDEPLGAIVNGVRNENIEQTTFENEVFDLVVSLDVTEHVMRPREMFQDIYRTLKFGGAYISTFPIQKWRVEASAQRAKLDENGNIQFLAKPPEYHGNPFDEGGSLVTWDYGYSIHEEIANWAPFSVEISRCSSRKFGILGDYTEVILCRKIKTP